MCSDVEKLKAARELIARPGGWTQNVFARDANGKETYPTGSAAVCWCMAGAIRAVGESFCGRASMKVRQAIGGEVFGIAVWNDATARTQAEVVAAFDRAIALAEASHV